MSQVGMVGKATTVGNVLIPLTVSGCHLLLRPEGLAAVADGAGISLWPDESGFANDPAQATGTAQPTKVNAAVNGLAAALFNPAASQRLRSTTADVLTAFNNVSGATMFVVCTNNVADATTRQAVFWTSNNTNQSRASMSKRNTSPGLMAAVGRRLDTDASQQVVGVTPMTADEWAVHCGVLDYANAQASIYRNGTLEAGPAAFQTAGNTSATNSVALGIGSLASAAGTEFWSGRIAEIIVYNRALTGPERDLVTNYLLDRYGAAGTVNDYGFPSYATLLARPNRVNLAAVHGAETVTQISYGTAVGDDVTFNAEGWKGRPNGGKNGLTWFAGFGYVVGDMVEPITANGFCYKVTAAGTSGGSQPTWPTTVGTSVTANGVTYKNVGAITASNPTAFNLGSTGPISAPRRVAVLGSTPGTATANVGRVDGLDVNNAQELFPLDTYRWGWADRKGLPLGSDPNGGWTGPNLDEHGFRIRGMTEGGAWSTIVDGMVFRDANDPVGLQSEAGSRTIFRNCLFLDVGDDCVEADFNNNSAEYYDCLFLNVYTIHSTTGARNASAEQTLLKQCVVVHNRMPWKTSTATMSPSCPGVALSDMTLSNKFFWGHGNTFKQPSSTDPRVRIEDTKVFMPGYAIACKSGTGYASATFSSASNSSFRFGRGRAVTAGNGTAVPQVTAGLEDYAGGYIPTGMTLVNDSSATYDSEVQAAIDAWVNGTDGHNPHPQFAGLLP